MHLADQLHCPPWELDPDPLASRYVWMQRQRCINECAAEAERWWRQRSKPRPSGRRR